jgi:hypothetical protein
MYLTCRSVMRSRCIQTRRLSAARSRRLSARLRRAKTHYEAFGPFTNCIHHDASQISEKEDVRTHVIWCHTGSSRRDVDALLCESRMLLAHVGWASARTVRTHWRRSDVTVVERVHQHIRATLQRFADNLTRFCVLEAHWLESVVALEPSWAEQTSVGVDASMFCWRNTRSEVGNRVRSVSIAEESVNVGGEARAGRQHCNRAIAQVCEREQTGSKLRSYSRSDLQGSGHQA